MSTKGRCQKHPEGGSLKFAANSLKTLTPPKNSLKDMYPSPLDFGNKTWMHPINLSKNHDEPPLKKDDLGLF